MSDRSGQPLGNYQLLHLLGQGGFADVYLGQHIHLGTLAAIKVLQVQIGNHDVEKFLQEAKVIAHLSHPHIVRVLDFGVEGGIPFLVMEHAPNGSLRELYPKGTRLPLTTIVSNVKQVGDALQYAHEQKLIHRDVKPENMLLGKNNKVLLSDFGIAVIQHNTNSQVRVEQSGTAPYMAPEQIMGRPRVASDQYALGVVVYEWLCGSLPFHGGFIEVLYQHINVPPEPLHAKLPTISPAVEEVILIALSKEPQQRFSSVQAFAAALEKASRARRTTSIIQPTHQPTQFTFSTTPERLSTLPDSANQVNQPVISTLQAPYRPIPSASLGEVGRVNPKNVRQKGLSKKKRALMLGLALFTVILGSVGIYYPISLNNAAKYQATVTAEVPILATSNARATATAAVNAYNTFVGANGVMFGFDAQQTRFNPFEKILNTRNVSHLVPAWSATISTTGGANFSSSPTVSKGVVYIGAWQAPLKAFDAQTGTDLWGDVPSSDTLTSPAVVDGMVYSGGPWTDVPGTKGQLLAFHAKTGVVAWTTPTKSVNVSSPTVVNGIVYFGSSDKKLYALDAQTGEALWTAPTGAAIGSTPAVANGVVYISSDKLYAFSAKTGAPIWAASISSSHLPTLATNSTPAVANGVVYISSDKLYAFSAKTGAPIWTASTSDTITDSPAVANGMVYIGSNDHKLYAFDAKTGAILWTATTGGYIGSSPTVANGVVYVGSQDSKLYAFDAKTGTTLWTYTVVTSSGIGISSSPTIANGEVYVGTDGSRIYAFHLPGTA
jgi:serine/threonine protein kinase/outer membrane protein assembly factor BamB